MKRDQKPRFNRHCATLNEKWPLTLWVSTETACQSTSYVPGWSGFDMGTMSWRFWFGSTVGLAVSTRRPLWSFTVNPENLATRSSVKVNRISFGDETVAPCAGSAVLRAGWA